MSDPYGYPNRTPYQRGGAGHNYGSQHQQQQQHSSQYGGGHPSNYNNSHHHQGRGGRGYYSPGNRGSGSGRGWSNSNQQSYGDRGNNYNSTPKNPQQLHFPQHHQQHSQSPSSFYPPPQQQQHQQAGGRQHEPWGNRGGSSRHLNQGNESYNYGQLSPNSERHRYSSGEPRNKISPSSEDHRTRFNSEELHRTRNNSDEQHRTRYQSDESHRSRFQTEEPHRTRNNSDEQQRTRFQSEEPRRRKTSNSEDQSYRHRTSPPDSDERRSKHSSSEDTRSKISPAEMKPGKTPTFDETKSLNKGEPSPSRAVAAVGFAKATSTPVKRRFSTQSNEDKDVTMEDAKTESDSDALVIDMDDAEPHDQKAKSNPANKSTEKSTENKDKGSKSESEKSKRPRRSTAHQTHDHESDEDDADDEKSRKSAKKSTNVAKDFKIPKKKAANQPPPSAETAANPLGSPLRTEKKFEQVEDALEAMFADLTGDTEEKPPVKAEVKTEEIKMETSSPPEASQKPKAANKSASKAQPKESAPKASTSKNMSKVTPPAKKKAPAKKGKQDTNKSFPVNQNGNVRINKKKKTATTQQEILLEKYNGPFVRVEGDPFSPRWTHVVNSTSDPLSYQDEKTMEKPDLEAKVRASGFGSHSTTLSSKYDARKPDESWLCVFCKKSSHYQGMGDLFGPYFASKEVMSSVNHRSPSKKQDLASKFIIGGAEEKKKKRRKIMASSPDHTPSWPQTDQTSPLQQYQNQQNAQASGGIEVWFHEDCVCWMPSLKIVGHSLLGLDEAIRQSHRELCTKCHLTGCTLGCVENGCRETAHFLCARQSGWSIDLESFQALCSTHSSDL